MSDDPTMPTRKRKFPASQLYLIHGNNEVEVSRARFELVHELLTPEERDSGLTEIQGAGTQPLKLDRALGDITEELGTSSFIADSRRVAVIYDLVDLVSASSGAKGGGAKKKAATPKRDHMDILCDWLEEVLPTTENIAIFVCNENDEKRRKVATNSRLFRLLKDKGVVVERSEPPLNYEFENHLIAGNTPAAIDLFREWLRRAGSDSGSRLRVYNTLAGVAQLALEARLVHLGKEEKIPENQILAETVFPRLSTLPPWKAKKFHELARGLSLETLHELLSKLNKLQMLLYPSGEEAHVASWEDLAEVVILQICTGARSSGALRS